MNRWGRLAAVIVLGAVALVLGHAAGLTTKAWLGL